MLHILLLEDSLLDAELIEAQLLEGGIPCAIARVETEADFRAALQSHSFDLILADYALPSFDGLSALQITQDLAADLPFIFVSATLGEEVALETLKNGATDYVLKQRLQRLVPSVQRALREARERRDRLRAEAALRESDRRFKMALKSSSICIFQQDRLLRYQWIHNPQGLESAEEIVGKTDYDLFKPSEADRLSEIKRQVLATGTGAREEVSVTLCNELRYYDLLVEPVFDERGIAIAIACTALNVTDRKLAERQRYRQEQQFRALAENAPDIIARLDRQFRHLYVNPAAEKATGIPPEAFLGKTYPELGFPEEVYAPWYEIWQHIFATGQSGSLEFQLPSSTQPRFYQSRVVPEFNFNGEVESLLCITRDITESKEAEGLLRESEARFRRLMDSNTIGMGFWQGDRITIANDAFLTIVGYTLSELRSAVGNWQDMTPVEYAELEKLANRQARDTGYISPIEKELFRKDGSRVPVIFGGAAFDRHAEEGVFFCLDLSERKQMEFALQQQAEELERANRIKDEFLAVLSHELRSPLNAILGWSKLLLNRKFDEASTRRALETIERNARSQTQLIEDLLDVSRILRGNLTLNVTPVNLTTTIQGAIDTMRLAAEAKSIQFDCYFDPTVGSVLGDASRLQQVVWNLLSNAVKFTPTCGRISIFLQQSDRCAAIEVSDTGIGIKPEFLPHLFEYFRQADASSTRKQGGLGIGLGLVRHLVELHGGTVSARSGGEGHGSTFTVQLPLMEGIHSSGDLPICNDDNTELAGVRVLLVDDDPDSLEFLQFTLETYGCEVRANSSAAEALTLISRWQPDILVSDIAMPEEDGYSLIRKLRAMDGKAGREIPAVALTAYAREQDRLEALKAGFQQHLAKPIEPIQLVAAIAGLVRVE